MFHIGEIHATAGSAYSCADPNFWYNTYLKSSTGKSNVKNTFRYDYLVNTDGKSVQQVLQFYSAGWCYSAIVQAGATVLLCWLVLTR